MDLPTIFSLLYKLVSAMGKVLVQKCKIQVESVFKYLKVQHGNQINNKIIIILYKYSQMYIRDAVGTQQRGRCLTLELERGRRSSELILEGSIKVICQMDMEKGIHSRQLKWEQSREWIRESCILEIQVIRDTNKFADEEHLITFVFSEV